MSHDISSVDVGRVLWWWLWWCQRCNWWDFVLMTVCWWRRKWCCIAIAFIVPSVHSIDPFIAPQHLLPVNALMILPSSWRRFLFWICPWHWRWSPRLQWHWWLQWRWLVGFHLSSSQEGFHTRSQNLWGGRQWQWWWFCQGYKIINFFDLWQLIWICSHFDFHPFHCQRRDGCCQCGLHSTKCHHPQTLILHDAQLNLRRESSPSAEMDPTKTARVELVLKFLHVRCLEMVASLRTGSMRVEFLRASWGCIISLVEGASALGGRVQDC